MPIDVFNENTDCTRTESFTTRVLFLIVVTDFPLTYAFSTSSVPFAIYALDGGVANEIITVITRERDLAALRVQPRVGVHCFPVCDAYANSVAAVCFFGRERLAYDLTQSCYDSIFFT